MRIAVESANQPEIIALIEDLDAYQKPLYPTESHHGVDIATCPRRTSCLLLLAASRVVL